MTRVGAIDCGTNSIRLLVADVDPATGEVTDLLRRMEIVRLGQGVDRTGRIDPAAMARTLAQAREYAAQCEELGAERVRFVATSASRDARNAGEFVEGVREAFSAFGTSPEVASGDEEASLSFQGATGELRAGGVAGPYLVVDLGGGSTEFVRGTDDVERERSLDVGSVRLTERHLRSDPPTPAEIEAATVDVDAALDEAALAVGFRGVGTLVGLAGSITTITARALRLDRYEPARIHGAELSIEQMTAACIDLLEMSREGRAALPYMHPGRVDVIGAGALVWQRIVERVHTESGITATITSEHDILDGIALSIA